MTIRQILRLQLLSKLCGDLLLDGGQSGATLGFVYEARLCNRQISWGFWSPSAKATELGETPTQPNGLPEGCLTPDVHRGKQMFSSKYFPNDLLHSVAQNGTRREPLNGT